MTAVPKVRLRFAKRGDLRLVSHHDLVRCVERALRRAALPVATTQGFNPRPKVTFALALALGIEGRREVVEIDLTEPMEPAEVLSRLAATSPPGLEWLGAEPATSNRAAQAEAVAYRLDLPGPRREAASAALADLLASESRPYARKRPDRTVELDLRPFLLDAEVTDEGALRFRLKVTNSGAAARPEDIVDVLGLADLTRDGAVLARIDIELAPEPIRPEPPAPKVRDPEPDSDSDQDRDRDHPGPAPLAEADDPPTDTPTTASERSTA